MEIGPGMDDGRAASMGRMAAFCTVGFQYSLTTISELSKGNHMGMGAGFTQVDWSVRLQSGTVNEQEQTFKEIFQSSQLRYVPERMKVGKGWGGSGVCRRLPWISEEIKDST